MNAFAILEAPQGSPCDNAPPDSWGRPWRNPFCPSCRHPQGPDGARAEGLARVCPCCCHDAPEGEGR